MASREVLVDSFLDQRNFVNAQQTDHDRRPQHKSQRMPVYKNEMLNPMLSGCHSTLPFPLLQPKRLMRSSSLSSCPERSGSLDKVWSGMQH